MKKFAVIFSVFVLFLTSACAFADEIVDAQGNVTTCTITSIDNGLIEYNKDGMARTFTREVSSPVFNDYVDVQTNIYKKTSIVRYTGQIILKDFEEVIIQTNEGNMRIPWYKVKLIGVYKP